MKKLREFLKRISKVEWVINFLFIFILCWIAVVVVKATFKEPEPSLDQKIDILADHIEVEFKYVEPVEGYWRIVKSGTTKMPDMSVMSNNGFITIPPNVTFDFTGSLGSKQITVYNDSDDLNSYNINFEIDEEMLREKILNIPGVSSVHIRGNYEIMVWKGKAWDWDEDKIHSRIVDVIVSQ